MCGKCGDSTVWTPLCNRCRRENTEAADKALRGKGTCHICGKAPRKRGSLYCHCCGQRVKEAAEARASKRPEWRDAFRVIHWRGYGVYTVNPTPLPDGLHQYRLRMLPLNAIKLLPKTGDQVIDLDKRVALDAEVVKQLKAAIMRVHNLRQRPDRNN